MLMKMTFWVISKKKECSNIIAIIYKKCQYKNNTSTFLNVYGDINTGWSPENDTLCLN